MKIGIDARLIDETGVGRYIRNLIHSLASIDTTNEYIVFLQEKQFKTFSAPNTHWQTRCVNVRWHSIAEQILLPFLFGKEKLDILHIPYFTVPLLYPGKIITTIHDITILHFPTGKSTTLPYPIYRLKWLAYRLILTIGILKSTAILTVSHTVKEQLIRYLPIKGSKITVTYEGVDPILMTESKEIKKISYPYFLYVGNVYPHKQAEFLVDSYESFVKNNIVSDGRPIPKLLFVGKNDFFYDRLEEKVVSKKLTEHVVFMHSVNDENLSSLYQGACALLFPSQSEGFGLPPLEALAHQCPVIVSDIPVFHELLENFAVFVSADSDKWSKAMEETWKTKSNFEPDDISQFLKRYSWNELAIKTKNLYESSTRI